MYPSEMLLVLALFGLLVTQNVRRMNRKAAVACFAVAGAALVSGLAQGQIRWQMTPGYLLFAILSVLLLRRTYSHVALRSIGIALGALLLGLAVSLSLALPIVTLPAPDGAHAVGFESFSLLDEARDDAYFGEPDERREISLLVWYPGTIDNAPHPRPVRTLWAELYRGPRDPITFFTGYLRGIETHTHEGIPLSPAEAPYPAIVFSHSFGLTGEQNTLLMEHLASHGYVVIGVTHTRMALRALSARGEPIYASPDRFQEAFAEGAADDTREPDERASRAAAADGGQEAVPEPAERADAMNEQVGIRAADVRSVLDAIAMPAKAPRELAAILEQVDADRVGLLGMSLGGTTVIDVCKIDPRCRAGVNLDGGRFGQHQREPLQTPFLSMVRAGNLRYDEPLLATSTSDYYEVLVDGASHPDFCDMTFLMPFMRWLGAAGPIAPMRAVAVVNAVTLEFFDAYLRGGPKPRFDPQELPELRVTTNVRVAH
ncbi:MAG TPA: hypothetical protein VFV10_03935 [Gammaproteobacteria bacterium]|nr:hypothetical protein [Gammaproteobacteria bacterium]